MKRLTINIFLTITLVLLLLFAAVYDLKAQSLEVTGSAKQTVMGNKIGYGVGFRSAKGFGASVFHQSTQAASFERSHTNYPFSGLDLSATLKDCGGLAVLAHIMTGLVNNQFIIATPEIETRITLAPFLKLGFGAGIRSRKAAVSAKLILSTF